MSISEKVSSLAGGLVMKEDSPLLLIHPILDAATGPFQGMEDMDRAADVATTDNISGSFSPSTESTVTITCTSFLNPLGKRGLIERSISLAFSMASSDGLPSRFTQPEPLILPPA